MSRSGHRLATACLAALAIAPATATAQDDDTLTVILDWFVNPDHAPLIVAQENGYFAEEGLEVELIAPADPNDPPKLVAAGEADIAVTYQPNLHLQVDQGLPLTRIGTLVATPLNSLVTLADGPVEGLADLDGARIGYSVGGFEETLLEAMMADAGVDFGGIELVNVNWALSGSLLAGRVDAVIGAFRNFELNQLELEERPGRAFYPEEHGVPAYDELIYVARNDALDDPRLVRFLAAVERGVIEVVNHPEATLETFLATDPELDTPLNRMAWVDTLPRLALAPAALDQGRYARFAAFLAESGMIDPPPPVGTYAVDLGAE
ncbi:MAG: ABC transporter substrate-binding protein [Azospirillaceae bacterium]